MVGDVSFQGGVDQYRAGNHYEAHELFEELWHEEADDDRRRFLQALIQVASAVHKAVNDVAPRGSLRLLDAAAVKLEGLGDVFLGVDLAGLREGMRGCRAEIARQLADTGHTKLTARHIPPLSLIGVPPRFAPKKSEPTVPAAARAAWFDRGLATYQSGDFFEAHELWEEIWRDTPEGFDRQFLQGLIQVAAAMHKLIAHHKPKPAARLLGRAIDKLGEAPPGYRGIDTRRLLREARQAKASLEAEKPLGDDGVPVITRTPR